MKKNLFLVSVIAMAMLTSCGTVPQPEQITVNPSPLAVVGDKVNADITGTFPVKKFAKKGILTVTPVLKFDGKEIEGEPVTYIGEKVKENGTMVSYKKVENTPNLAASTMILLWLRANSISALLLKTAKKKWKFLR